MPLVVSGPAGAGKTTLVEMLVSEHPRIIESISCTTRAPRENERDGEHYNFLSKEQFEEKIEQGAFLEYVKFLDHYYGTLKSSVLADLARGRHVIMVIDTQGAMRVRELLKAVSIFILPPSLDEQRERLEKRQSESKESLEKRLQKAEKELACASSFDYQIVNKQLLPSYQILRGLIFSEELRLLDESIKHLQ